MSRKFTLIVIAIVAALFTTAHSANAQQTRTTVAVPPSGGQYNPDYGNETFLLGIQGVSTGNAVQVQQVFPGTAADRLLLEAGDRVVSVNGRDVRTLADLAARLQDAARNRGGNISVLIDNVRARQGEYGAQRFVTNSTYLTSTPNYGGQVIPQSGPAIVTPNQIDSYDPISGTYRSSNVQIDYSALNLYRDSSRNNGTLRSVKRPIYDRTGNLVGFQEGQVWNNSVSGQEHGNLNNTTIDENGNIHEQQQTTSGYAGN